MIIYSRISPWLHYCHYENKLFGDHYFVSDTGQYSNLNENSFPLKDFSKPVSTILKNTNVPTSLRSVSLLTQIMCRECDFLL